MKKKKIKTYTLWYTDIYDLEFLLCAFKTLLEEIGVMYEMQENM